MKVLQAPRRLFFLGMGMLAASISLAGAATDWLRPWRWQARLLLLFAPEEGSPALRAQREMLEQAHTGLTERDIVPIEVIGDRASDSRLSGGALRIAFDVPKSRFAAILVGKDSGQKLRSNQPLSAERLFATVDSMPMRRDEAARRANP